ncbi:MAG TPA: VOC family protein [Solirubrobacteraceae bacterium]|nr:VOC family protein [Solirubrobacteraceae bacterium]
MSAREHYPPGAPCWVDVLADDPAAARAFYAGVFGWEFAGPGAMPDGGEYHVARLGEADVAGVGCAPDDAGAVPWTTYVRVASLEETTAHAVAAGARVIAEPFDALPAGRAAAVADPAGGVIGLWEPAERAGAARVNEPSAWAMSVLQPSDAPAATAFYEAVFGWQAWTPPGDASGIVLWRLPGYFGGEPSQPVPRDVVAAMLPASDDAPAGWSVDFWIADADAAATAAAELGGSVLGEPHDAPPFRRAVLADPSGAAFTVSQLVAY